MERAIRGAWKPGGSFAFFHMVPPEALEISRSEPQENTTVFMHNVPCAFKRFMLIRLLNDRGFAGKFDFLYLPIDAKTAFSKGIAFVNLTSERETKRFAKVFSGFKDWPLPSQKVCAVSPAKFQGLGACIRRYHDFAMDKKVPDSQKPLLFEGTLRVAWPCPTAKQLSEARREACQGEETTEGAADEQQKQWP